MSTISPFDVCRYILENSTPETMDILFSDYWGKMVPLDDNQKQAFIKCIEVLYNTLKKTPFIVNPSEKIPAEQFNLEGQLTNNDYKQIWKWMLDDYKYEGPYYRSQVLEKKYFKNYSIQDEPIKFLRNAPTNTIRTLKSYSGIIGQKEKDLINKCLVDFYNLHVNYQGNVQYAGELKPLIYIYSNARQVLEKKPPLTQAELDDIFNDPRLLLPEDISKVIGEYLGATQNAGRKKRRKSRKGRKVERRVTKKRRNIKQYYK